MNTNPQFSADKHETRKLATGRWLEVLVALAPSLSDAADDAALATRKGVPSPLRSNSKKDGFKFDRNANQNGIGYDNALGTFDGFSLLMELLNITFNEAVNQVYEYLTQGTVNSCAIETPKRYDHVKPVKAKGCIKKCNALWSKCNGSVNHEYFRNRGITMDLSKFTSIRYTPKLFTKLNGHFFASPGLIFDVTDPNGQRVVLHRLFLNKESNGKNPTLEDSKLMMSIPEGRSLSGASIKFGEPVNGVLAVAEGMETALSVTQLTGIPCWSTVNTFGMKTFIPPKNVHTLLVFGDKDPVDPLTDVRPGSHAAEILKQRMLKDGLRCLKIFPAEDIPDNQHAYDWNDVLVNNGRFPTWEVIQKYL